MTYYFPLPQSKHPYERLMAPPVPAAIAQSPPNDPSLSVLEIVRESTELRRVVFEVDAGDDFIHTGERRMMPRDADDSLVLRHAMGWLYREGYEPVAYHSVTKGHNPERFSDYFEVRVWVSPFHLIEAMERPRRTSPPLHQPSNRAVEAALDFLSGYPRHYHVAVLALKEAITIALRKDGL